LKKYGGCAGSRSFGAPLVIPAMLLCVVLMKRKKSDSAHEKVTLHRNGILAKEPKVSLSGEVECLEPFGISLVAMDDENSYDGKH